MRWVIVWRQCLELYGVVELIAVQGESLTRQGVLGKGYIYILEKLKCQRKLIPFGSSCDIYGRYRVSV